MPGTFCDAIATTNSGMPMLTIDAIENAGIVNTGCASAMWKRLKSSRPRLPATAVPTISVVTIA